MADVFGDGEELGFGLGFVRWEPSRPVAPVPRAEVTVPTADGAQVHAYVYAPRGVSDEPGTPFAVLDAPAPVLVLHGNGEDHAHMDALVGPLSSARSVIATDTRGHGASTRGTESLSYELFAEDALEVLNSLGVVRAHVLGFSDGGIVALLLARDHPERVCSVTTLGANLVPEGIVAPAREDIRRGYEELGGDGADQGPDDGACSHAELLRLMLEQPHIDAASLAAVRCPACIMAGDADLIEPVETRRIAETIPGARKVIVMRAGHDLPHDAPATVVAQCQRTMTAGEPRRRRGSRSLLELARCKPSGEVRVVPATEEDEPAVLELYERVTDACELPDDTSGWRRGSWPLPHDVSDRLRRGTTWVAVDKDDRVLGAMSLDGDLGMPGVEAGWEELGEDEQLVCHLLVSDPDARGRGVATALLAEYVREGRRRGVRALRINTGASNVRANALYHELGFTLWKPVWFPYQGLDLTGWSCLYELRLA